MHIFILLFIQLNTLSFFLMMVDKILALKRAFRIPEMILLFFGLLGGIGIVLGSLIFNHKHSKIVFRWVMALEVLLHVFLAIKFL